MQLFLFYDVCIIYEKISGAYLCLRSVWTCCVYDIIQGDIVAQIFLL